jgi:hypothetical protein
VLLNRAAHIEETATQFPQYALLHTVTCVQLRLITILGNCGCVAVASFLGVPSPLVSPFDIGGQGPTTSILSRTIVPQTFDFRCMFPKTGLIRQIVQSSSL